MLRTRQISPKKSPEDGMAISIMSRHTLEDGKTPDGRITRQSFDIHMPELAPDPSDVGAFYRPLASGGTREQLWPGFKAKYLAKLKRPTEHARAVDLASVARAANVTLLCAEDLSQRPYCHRFILADECAKLNPLLEIRHL